MLLREVLSDTPQPSSVEEADEQEHCSLSLKSRLADVCGSFDIKLRAIRWNKFRQIFISLSSDGSTCIETRCHDLLATLTLSPIGEKSLYHSLTRDLADAPQ
jgi:hypothetical protein